MVSKESNHLLAQCNNFNQEKAMTVRSVLLNRDSPDIENRLKRRRNRTQQVRFKDLVDGEEEDPGKSPPDDPLAKPELNTPCASTPRRHLEGKETEKGTKCVSLRTASNQPCRQHWYQSRPCSLTLPNPKKACMSTAIQTSPSLQKQFPAFRFRSKSVSDFGKEELLMSITDQRGTTGEEESTTAQLPSSERNDACMRALNGRTSASPQLVRGCSSEHNHQPASHSELQQDTKHASDEGLHYTSPYITLCHKKVPNRLPVYPCQPQDGRTCDTARNSNSHASSCTSERTIPSPKFHPFYPLNIAAMDHSNTNSTVCRKNSPSSSQWSLGSKHLSREEPVTVLRQKQPSRNCNDLSYVSGNSKVEGSPAMEDIVPLQKNLQSHLSNSPHQILKENAQLRSSPQTKTQETPVRDSVIIPKQQINSIGYIIAPRESCPHDCQPTVSECTECHSVPQTFGEVSRTSMNEKGYFAVSKSKLPQPRSPDIGRCDSLETIEKPSIQDDQSNLITDITELGEPRPSSVDRTSVIQTGCSQLKFIQSKSGSKNADEQKETLQRPISALVKEFSNIHLESGFQSPIQDTSEGHCTFTAPDVSPAAPGAQAGNKPTSSPNTQLETGLTANQSETLRQVQELLELVAAAKGKVDLSKIEESFLSQGHLDKTGCLRTNKEAEPIQARPFEMGQLQSRLQALEEVLQTSQHTIKVLLDVIQDLEKKEAKRDGALGVTVYTSGGVIQIFIQHGSSWETTLQLFG
ncbi:uncharacterized protein LOC115461207 isoform X2 [Microcaecilia unicolor]|uniref:Uncharacterized protein LOC115461207 isoform X2 n=1 Tax=Microcaecilia unicolor TaxID=1415580 RepID=A0A6P7X833_9AMPH|nr:uncharacterized protein LOC115461207 isoform X2 [Microcaecilia unicolor]